MTAFPIVSRTVLRGGSAYVLGDLTAEIASSRARSYVAKGKILPGVQKEIQEQEKQIRRAEHLIQQLRSSGWVRVDGKKRTRVVVDGIKYSRHGILGYYGTGRRGWSSNGQGRRRLKDDLNKKIAVLRKRIALLKKKEAPDKAFAGETIWNVVHKGNYKGWRTDLQSKLGKTHDLSAVLQAASEMKAMSDSLKAQEKEAALQTIEDQRQADAERAMEELREEAALQAIVAQQRQQQPHIPSPEERAWQQSLIKNAAATVRKPQQSPRGPQPAAVRKPPQTPAVPWAKYKTPILLGAAATLVGAFLLLK